MRHPLLLQMMSVHHCTVISQDDGLQGMAFMNYLPAAQICVVGSWNKFIVSDQEAWKNGRQE
jgi:hypothetical protein